MLPRKSGLASLIGMTAFLAIGCGGREFAEVEGQITLEGKPLGDVEVLFLPDPLKGNQGNNASAFTDPEGKYKLLALRDHRTGTVLGPHRVAITDLTMVIDTTGTGGPGKTGKIGPTMPGTTPRRFPREYGDPLETPFQEIDIVSGKQTCNFDLKAGPVRAGSLKADNAKSSEKLAEKQKQKGT